MLKRFNPNKDIRLESIVDQIVSSLNCSKFSQNRHLIEIDAWDNIKGIMPHNKEVAEAGFGFCIPNFREYGKLKWLIVINVANCIKAELSDKEIAAIIVHELGHLLNYPKLLPVPTFSFCMERGINFDAALLDEIKKHNESKIEVYADAYANQHGYGKELITSFEKQNEVYSQKVNYLEARIKSIKNNEKLDGQTFDNSIFEP